MGEKKKVGVFWGFGTTKIKVLEASTLFFSEQERCGLSLSLLARALSLSLRSWSVAEESEK